MESDDEARQAFKALDKSCNGFLSLADVKTSFSEVLPNIPSTVIEQVNDAAHSGHHHLP